MLYDKTKRVWSWLLFCLFHSTSRQRCKTKRRRLTNSDYLQQSLALQNRSVQLERQRLKVEREKLEVMKVISSELTSLRVMYTAVNGIQVIGPEPAEE